MFSQSFIRRTTATRTLGAGLSKGWVSMRYRFLAIGLFALVATPMYASPASAGGYELPLGGGQRSLGRGGTGMARADDPLMAFLNPAALGSMPGQFMVGTEAVLLKACVNLRPFEGETADPPEVCNGSKPGDRLTMLPLLGATMRLHKRVGMLIGIDPPYSAREMQWSVAEQTNANGQSNQGFYRAEDGSLFPAPTRYMLIDDNVVVVYPTIALGVKISDYLQLGLGFSWGFARVQFVNTTRFATAATDQAFDQPTIADIQDKFVPRVVGSAHFTPIDSLDIMAMVRWDDSIKANGITTATTPLGQATGPVRFTAPRPLWAGLGIRYGKRINPRPTLAEAEGKSGATDDKMKNEKWDIEANVIYENNSSVGNLTFDAGTLDIPIAGSPDAPPLEIQPFTLQIPHNWKDQVSVRVGSDWNVMPGKLALRAGASFETLGFNKGFGFIDYLPLQRYGVSAGLSGRFGSVELTLGYAFLTTKTFDDAGENTQIVIDTNGPIENTGLVLNNGTFQSKVHVLGWSIRIIAE